jgi:hypothetical protein
MKNLIIATVMLAIACSGIGQKSIESKASDYLREFEQAVAKSDSAALKFFNSTQSQSSIVAALKYLRNPEPENVNAVPNFSSPLVLWDNDGLRAIVHVSISAADGTHADVPVIFWLKREQGNFSIDRMEAEKFYSYYVASLVKARAARELAANTKRIERYLTIAKSLRQTYDSVLWYVAQDTSTFFYVVKGSWQEPNDNEELRTELYDMGVVGWNGKVIVPVRYDLISTPGIFEKGLFEVQQAGKIGYYTLDGKEVVPARYDQSIPYSNGNSFAIVKSDSVHGWLDKQFNFHDGFPSDHAKTFYTSYNFLSTNLDISDSTYSLCRIPSPDYIIYGSIVPPAYLVEYGLLSRFENHFLINERLTEEDRYSEGMQYIRQEGFSVFDLSNTIKLLVSTFKNRYIGGREEFYYTNRLTLVNDSLNFSSRAEISYAKTVQFRKISDEILEVRKYYDSWEPDEYLCTTCPSYAYFKITLNNGLEEIKDYSQLNSVRYAYLDSSYFVGTFKVWNIDKNDRIDTVDFVPLGYVEALRDEILAINGYKFQNQQTQDRYDHEKWYVAKDISYDAIMESAPDRDRHNLKFLEQILGKPKETTI